MDKRKLLPFVLRQAFSFQGRMSRAAYFLVLPLALVIIEYAFAFLEDMTFRFGCGDPCTIDEYETSYHPDIFLILPLVFSAWCIAATTCRRLHDIGWSGWWQLVAWVPLGGILFALKIFDSGAGEKLFFNDHISILGVFDLPYSAQSSLEVFEIGHLLLMLSANLLILTVCAGSLILTFCKSQPGPNRFG